MSRLPTIIIDRNRWVHAGRENAGKTKLLNDEGYQCCLGFYCEQSGIPRSLLRNRTVPVEDSSWREAVPALYQTCDVPPWHPAWLSLFCANAIRLNDDVSLRDEEREQGLIDLFRENGIELVFIGLVRE